MSVEFLHINLAYLEHMTEGDRALQQQTLLTLARELQTEIPKMRALLGTGSWRDLAEVSHRFKSSLAYVGNDRVTEVNSEIERLAQERIGFERLPGLLAELEAAQPLVLAELQAAAAIKP